MQILFLSPIDQYRKKMSTLEKLLYEGSIHLYLVFVEKYYSSLRMIGLFISKTELANTQNKMK